jgi:hypothetical protein
MLRFAHDRGPAGAGALALHPLAVPAGSGEHWQVDHSHIVLARAPGTDDWRLLGSDPAQSCALRACGLSGRRYESRSEAMLHLMSSYRPDGG